MRQFADYIDGMLPQEALTQTLGDTWHAERRGLLLRVPSAIVPVAGSPDLNIVVNHSHSDAPKLRIAGEEPFVLDTPPLLIYCAQPLIQRSRKLSPSPRKCSSERAQASTRSARKLRIACRNSHQPTTTAASE